MQEIPLALLDRLKAAGDDQQFFQLVRLILCASRTSIGRDALPKEEVLRLRPAPLQAFPAGNWRVLRTIPRTLDAWWSKPRFLDSMGRVGRFLNITPN